MTASLTAILFHLVWQGALIGAAAWVALRLVGRSAGATRYRIAIGALGLLTLAPLATAARRSGWLAGASPGLVAVFPESLRAMAVPPTPALDSALAAPGAGPGRTGGIPVEPILLGIWLAGAGFLLIRLAHGLTRLEGLRRRSVSAPAWLTTEAQPLARRLGVAGAVDVRVSPEAGIPLAVGVLRRTVILPVQFADRLPHQQVRLVLAHEIAHIARHDYAVNLAQHVVQSLCFFHPAVHWLSRLAREEREHCCDELAARLEGNGREVAGALMALEELAGGMRPNTLAPAATGGFLLRRIERLISAPGTPRRLSRAGSAAVFGMALPLLILATPARARIAAGAERYAEVWAGDLGRGDRLRVRNLVGSIRVASTSRPRATIRARVSGASLPDLVFEPIRDAGGVTLCAIRRAHGRCDAEGTTWFGTPEEMRRAVIDLVVELPAGAAITAASFDGDLVVDGVSGDVEARTGAGDIRVVMPPGFDRSRVKAVSGRGSVLLSGGS